MVVIRQVSDASYLLSINWRAAVRRRRAPPSLFASAAPPQPPQQQLGGGPQSGWSSAVRLSSRYDGGAERDAMLAGIGKLHRALVEARSSIRPCIHRSVVDLTEDRPLRHGRVDEGGFGMPLMSDKPISDL